MTHACTTIVHVTTVHINRTAIVAKVMSVGVKVISTMVTVVRRHQLKVVVVLVSVEVRAISVVMIMVAV